MVCKQVALGVRDPQAAARPPVSEHGEQVACLCAGIRRSSPRPPPGPGKLLKPHIQDYAAQCGLWNGAWDEAGYARNSVMYLAVLGAPSFDAVCAEINTVLRPASPFTARDVSGSACMCARTLETFISAQGRGKERGGGAPRVSALARVDGAKRRRILAL